MFNNEIYKQIRNRKKSKTDNKIKQFFPILTPTQNIILTETYQNRGMIGPNGIFKLNADTIQIRILVSD